MHLIDNRDATDPAVNLAVEEYCLRRLDQKNDYFLLYINDPSVVIGRNQNPFKEADRDYAEDMGIRIIRRISGGGAVYQDHGNLNFSFITDFGKDGLKIFKHLLRPILSTIASAGVRPELMKNNTIFIEREKISGNAQFTDLNRLLSHGTLLFTADLTMLNRVLCPTADIIHSAGVESNRSPVTNICQQLRMPMDLFRFRRKLIEDAGIFFGKLEKKRLSDRDWDNVIRLAERKYRSWEWNYGRTPLFTVRHRFDGNVVRLHVNRGHVQKIEPEGKASGRTIRSLPETDLIGSRYDPEKTDRLFTSTVTG